MKKILASMAAVLAMVSATSFATPVLGYVETWNSGLGTGGDWQYADLGLGAASLANSGGTLQLTLPNSGLPYASMYANGASSGGHFSGDFYSLANGLSLGSSNLVVQFNLQALDNINTASGSMLLYFVGNGNTYIYNYDFAQAPVGSNALYQANIGSAASWLGSGTFSSDFANVTEFGLQLFGSGLNTTHRYQLDNLTLEGVLQVPEPETIWMMVMVLGSLALTFRGRLTDIGAQVKARFTA